MRLSRLFPWLFLTAAIIFTCFAIASRILVERQLNLEGPVYYTVHPGDNAQRITRSLSRYGIIEHPRFLAVMFRLLGNDKNIQAGTYQLHPQQSLWQLNNLLAKGDIAYQGIRIGEGSTWHEVKQLLNTSGWMLPSQQKLTLKALSDFYQHPLTSVEGLLLPDTYFVVKDSQSDLVWQRAANAMLVFMAKHWPQRAPSKVIKTPYDAMILASIVEKETSVDSERARVAGVLSKRLQLHIPLQADPTIIYALGDRYQDRLRKKDLKLKSPFNTYLHQGLPPTPIAMPSRESVLASLHPQISSELYYVAKPNSREHQFSSTLAEHRQAVKSYWAAKRTP